MTGDYRFGVGHMNSLSILRVAALSATLPACFIAYSQGDPDTLARIVDEGKNHSQIVDRLHYVCFDIGARLTSSPELYRGQKWAIAQFKNGRTFRVGHGVHDPCLVQRDKRDCSG